MLMNLKFGVLVVAFALMSVLGACKENNTNSATPSSANNAAEPVSLKVAGPLPEEGFKAEVSIADPPKQLRVGQVEVVNIKVKNTSNVIWWQRGGETNERSDNIFYIAAGNRWIDQDGNLTSETEGHNGIPRDLKPGEEAEMALQITAPKKPGEWTLDLDMVQEGVAWFSEKGSPTTKVKVTVVK